MQKLSISRKPSGTLSLPRKARAQVIPAAIPAPGAELHNAEALRLSAAPPAAPPETLAPSPGVLQNMADLKRGLENLDRKRAPSINKRADLRKIAAYWPELFRSDFAFPLVLGVQELLIADAKARNLPVTPSAIKALLTAYCQDKRYLKKFATATQRVTLDGSLVGEVDALAKEHAQKGLARRSGNEKRERIKQAIEVLERRYDFRNVPDVSPDVTAEEIPPSC